MKEPIPKAFTGVPGLDRISQGGIPEGRSTLVAGRAGTGKTILGLQIASELARRGQPVLILAVEESPEDLLATGDALGMGLSDLVREGRVRLSDASRPVEGPVVVSGGYDISGLVHRVEALTRAMGARAVVLDSATALFSPQPPRELLRSLFFQLVHAFRRLDLTAVILAEADETGQLALGVEDYVCDVVIKLRNIVDGERRRRSIEINKYRRSAHQKGEYPFTITNRGISIFPLDLKTPPPAASDNRYSSGVPGLDTMISGGLFRDSIVIVRGPTGSGKTLLAGLYAQAGAQRGERVVYYGLEEPKPILLRNFRSIGMPLDELEASGRLVVSCNYPESMGLEDLLEMVRHGLEELKPSLIVVDSISSIEHSASVKGFRQFMIGLASMLREYGRGAVLTQTVTGGDEGFHTMPFLSTVADAILALDYSTKGYEMHRTLRVLKMRGSPHETYPYRMRIEDGGLRLEPDAVRPGVVAPPRGTRLAGRSILLVEDYEDARETAAMVLRAEGADVTAVGTSEEAFEAFRAKKPDVIVADIGLPEQDGFELLERVRALPETGGRIAAVAFTAWGMPADRERARQVGFQEHLLKPVEPSALVDAVARVLAG